MGGKVLVMFQVPLESEVILTSNDRVWSGVLLDDTME